MKLKSFEYTPLKYTVKGKIATLESDIEITLHTTEGLFRLIISKGFRWNGNSGAFPCRFHKTNTRYNVIILVHDALYHRIGVSRADADQILCDGIKQSGYSKLMAEMIHFAVTTFARHAYNEDDEMTLDNLDCLALYKDGIEPGGIN